MTIRFAGAFVGLLCAASAAWAQAESVTAEEFAKKASVGNTFEIESSKLALDRATDQHLKDFARKMIDDHTAAEKKLQAAAGKAHDKVELMLDKPHQAMLDNLKTFKGEEFDKIYKADQVAAHAESVNLLSDYQHNGDNSDLRSWAKSTLPTVKGHQAMINAMEM